MGKARMEGLRRRRVDIRRMPFLTFERCEVWDATELTEATDVIDVAVREGVLACLRYSFELSDCGLVESEVWDEDCTEGSGVIDGSGGAELLW